jgi:hypothetical protein
MPFRLLWVVIAGLHITAAAYAWHLLPHGFGWTHPRFWCNEAFPFILVAAGGTCLFGLWRQRMDVAAIPSALFVALHVAMAPAWIAVFPITGKRPAVTFALIALVMCACAVTLRRAPRWALAVGAAIGLVMGVAVPWSQRGPAPGTHPAEAVRALEPGSDGETVTFDVGSVHIALHPLLTFWSRSPDRGWTVFAGAQPRGDERSTLRVTSPDDTEMHIDAETLVPTAVYSHLNTFTTIEVRGHHRLFLGFSPCPDQRIEVTYMEYPTGRPERFAYMDAASELHVVEAESGEKGPYTELAHGPLSAPLAITLFDDQTPLARIELADFASQASTQPSPTAGWGVPENAIEFSLARDRPDAAVAIYLTLAATSVGRGWDSVGHAPGIYRNRIVLKRLHE